MAMLITGLWAAALWGSSHVHTDDTLNSVALFAHLSALIVGFGAVLVIDWVGLLWVLGRRRLVDVLTLASANHPLIWLSLVVLTASGALLNPDLSAFRTQIKLGVVLVVALNGVQAYAVHQQLERNANAPSRGLLLRSSLSASVSQAGWWIATLIGFLTDQSR